MKTKIIIATLAAVFCGCTVKHFVSSNIEGTYAQLNEDGLRTGINLTFTKSAFLLIDKFNHELSPYICCDTIAYGTWRIDSTREFLTVSSADYLSSFIGRSVTEKVMANQDSLYFNITNPIESGMGSKHHNIYYTLFLNTSIASNPTSHDFALDKKNYDIEFAVADSLFNTNKIAIANPNHVGVLSFRIDIMPSPAYNGRSISINRVHTIEYKVNDRRANSFSIDMPELTYSFFTFLRLKKDFIRVSNNNELEWDGLKYIKNTAHYRRYRPISLH